MTEEENRKYKVFFYAMDLDGVAYMLPAELPRTGDIINLPPLEMNQDLSDKHYKVGKIVHDYCHKHDSKYEDRTRLMHHMGEVHVTLNPFMEWELKEMDRG